MTTDSNNKNRPASDGAGLTYAQSGVSIDAGADLVDRIGPMVERTKRPGVVGSVGGFGGLFDLKAAGYKDPLLVGATDGVGTKLRIAIETGKIAGVGVDLVAMCVNDLLCQGAEPLFFLDYYATGKLSPETGAAIVAGVSEGCVQAGCALIGGETAEMPGMYHGDDFDLAGFAVGAVERDGLLPREAQPGDAIIGLAASGPHSNGYSLIRKIIAHLGLDWSAPAPFAPDHSLGEALLTPTRIYIKPILPLLRAEPISALAHITGGGLTENLPRVLTDKVSARVDLSRITAPQVFHWLAQSANVAEQEMLRTFNCGVGMVVICENARAEAIVSALKAAGEDASVIGAIEARGQDAPAIRYEGALFA